MTTQQDDYFTGLKARELRGNIRIWNHKLGQASDTMLIYVIQKATDLLNKRHEATLEKEQ